MRQDHHLLMTKLCNLGVPGWLLKLVYAFLSDRKMFVIYNGEKSELRSMPGGGPQGTLLALILFLVLVDDIGFEDQSNNAGILATSKRNIKIFNELHLKYVDDLTLVEAINMQETLKSVPLDSRQLPDNYHSRTGHSLPLKDSRVFSQLMKTHKKAENEKMKINFRKTKAMLFNPCKSLDFFPCMNVNDKEIEVVDEIKLLGVTISSDLKWKSNTRNMVEKASKRLWIVRRLKNLGADQDSLVDVYVKQIRPVLELAVPVWQGALSQEEKIDLERIQKSACHIILGKSYTSYKNALLLLNLETLEYRRNKLSLKFALKASKHQKFRKWFIPKQKIVNTRNTATKYKPVRASHARYSNSPLGYLTDLLNSHYKKMK